MPRRSVPATGTLEDVSIADLLQHLEESRSEGEARVETAIGLARIWFRDGCLLDAEMGDAHGEAAAFRLLGASAGSYTIERKQVARLRMIHDTVAALLGRRQRRTSEWQRLVDEMPSLDTVLTMDAARFAQLESKVPPVDAQLLGLVDSRRSIVELVDESGFDAIAALERLAWYVRARVLQPQRAGSSVPPSRDPVMESRERLNALARDLLTDESVIQSKGLDTPGRSFAWLPGSAVSDEPPEDEGAETHAADARSETAAAASIVPAPTVSVGHLLPEAFHVAASPRRSLSPPRTQIGLKPPELAPSAAPAHGGKLRALLPNGVQPLLPPRRVDLDTWPGRLLPIEPADVPWRVERGDAPSDPPPSALLEQSAPLPPERTVLGRYEILSRIARGGMGTVYLCRVTGEGGFRRLFALKVLRRHLARDRSAADMFLREAQVAARIYDPHVVGIVDVGTYGAQPYLVMDYIEGGSFHELLQRHPKYRPPRLVIPILVDALCGLHAAHTLLDDQGEPLGLVHCDVSPHNLLIGVDGSGRLSDFGIAKAAMAAAHPLMIATRGKPAYLAPEQAAHQPVDHRTDVFSVGVVMWNALTGERLFDGPTVEETIENVLSRRIPPPSTIGLKPPPCLDAICLKALARDPAARYQSAEQMMQELRAVALHEDLLASPSDVARWVVATFGPELQARRLAALDASRRGRGAEVALALPEVDRLTDPPSAVLARVCDGPPSSGPVPSDDYSRTVALSPMSGESFAMVIRNRVLLVAVVVSIVAVVLALFFPQDVARLFRLSADAPLPKSSFSPTITAPAAVQGKQAPLESTPAQAQGGATYGGAR